VLKFLIQFDQLMKVVFILQISLADYIKIVLSNSIMFLDFKSFKKCCQIEHMYLAKSVSSLGI
jgi:hypothetical protein